GQGTDRGLPFPPGARPTAECLARVAVHARAAPGTGRCRTIRHRHDRDALHGLYRGNASNGRADIGPARPAGASDRRGGGGAARVKPPTVFEPLLFVLSIGLALVGVVIGLELLTRVGVTPNTSIIGAIFAMGLARSRVAALSPLRSVARQNLL